MIDSIRYRLFWLKYGVVFGKSSSFRIRSLKIGSRKVTLRFPEGEASVVDYETTAIFHKDCYGLVSLGSKPRTIVDVGANIGLFSMAARAHAPNAVIHAYEPNPKLKEILSANLAELDVEVHHEALGKDAGMVAMDFGEGSLYGTTQTSPAGQIRQSAVEEMIERVGGQIDVLKLDCEGAEWEILQVPAIWDAVKCFTMEYHLWANREMDLVQLIALFKSKGYRITHLHESPELEYGILRAVRV